LKSSKSKAHKSSKSAKKSAKSHKKSSKPHKKSNKKNRHHGHDGHHNKQSHEKSNSNDNNDKESSDISNDSSSSDSDISDDVDATARAPIIYEVVSTAETRTEQDDGEPSSSPVISSSSNVVKLYRGRSSAPSASPLALISSTASPSIITRSTTVSPSAVASDSTSPSSSLGRAGEKEDNAIPSSWNHKVSCTSLGQGEKKEYEYNVDANVTVTYTLSVPFTYQVEGMEKVSFEDLKQLKFSMLNDLGSVLLTCPLMNNGSGEDNRNDRMRQLSIEIDVIDASDIEHIVALQSGSGDDIISQGTCK
jgi:hypothetical protein